MGSGPILLECLKASETLKTEFNIGSRVYSVTSYSELEKNCRETKRQNLFNPSNIQRNYLQELVDNNDAVIATSDYVRSYSQMISSYIKNKFIPMGTDGFGRSDTRDNLRDFFEIDSKHIVIETLFNFFEENKISIDVLQQSLKKYGINSNIDHPWKR